MLLKEMTKHYIVTDAEFSELKDMLENGQKHLPVPMRIFKKGLY